METLRFITFVILFGLYFTYENISRRNTSLLSQSSNLNDNIPSLANDGDRRTGKGLLCSHTAFSHSKAWLQVDLGEQFSINNVKIYYRTEDIWKQYRFRQFYLDVSDIQATQTKTDKRIRCNTDNTTAPNLPPNIIDIPCGQTARYVIVETTYDASDDNAKGAMLEICEIEVYGCPIKCMGNVCNKTNGRCLHGCKNGHWASTCNSCPTQHCRSCNRNTGHCHKCNAGFEGYFCDQCDSKHFGSNCTHNCSLNCEDGCSRETGTCYNCKKGKFGILCNEMCSRNCEGECDRNSGVCYNCTEGRYGDWCNKTCGTGCVSGCDQFSGTCTCKSGWEGEGCDECHLTRYGTYCMLNCSQYCLEGCFRKTGSCYNCTDGRYGEWCNETCGAGCVSGCDQFNGTCTCKSGWEGDRCDVQWKENAEKITHQVLSFIIILPVVSSICFFLVIRHRWSKQSMRRIQHSKDTEGNSRNSPNDLPEANRVIYENVGGRCEHQDLSQFREQSHQNQTYECMELKDDIYQNMRTASEDRELHQLSEHTTYEPMELNNIYENMKTGTEDRELHQHSEHSLYEFISLK